MMLQQVVESFSLHVYGYYERDDGTVKYFTLSKEFPADTNIDQQAVESVLAKASIDLSDVVKVENFFIHVKDGQGSLDWERIIETVK